MNLPVNLGFKVRGKKIPVNLGAKFQGQGSQTLQLKLNIHVQARWSSFMA